jgi:hypothetical protein
MWFGGYRTYSRAGWAPDPAFVNSARLAKADRKNRLPPEWPRAAIVSQFPAAFGRSRRPHGVAGSCRRSSRCTCWPGTVLAPQLWIEPLGPFTKMVPLLVATLFTLAILDER